MCKQPRGAICTLYKESYEPAKKPVVAPSLVRIDEPAEVSHLTDIRSNRLLRQSDGYYYVEPETAGHLLRAFGYTRVPDDALDRKLG